MNYIITENQLKYIINEMPYPTDFSMDTFKSLTSFQKRIQYCTQFLKRIAEGSSRIAFLVDDEKVLKLAKNKKGLIQNENEASIGYNNTYFSCIAKVLDFDEDNYTFVEMERATKCTENDFKRIVGYDINTVNNIIEDQLYGDRRYPHARQYGFTMDQYDEFYESEFITDIVGLAHNSEMLLGDLGKITSYGIVKRNGVEDVVLVDYGLTETNFKKHYRGR